MDTGKGLTARSPRRNWAQEQYGDALLVCAAMKLFRSRQWITYEQWERLVPLYMKRKLHQLDYVHKAQLGVLLTLQGLEVLAYREASG